MCEADSVIRLIRRMQQLGAEDGLVSRPRDPLHFGTKAAGGSGCVSGIYTRGI